jgi:hypothetical protein
MLSDRAECGALHIADRPPWFAVFWVFQPHGIQQLPSTHNMMTQKRGADPELEWLLTHAS